ncbi:hypothetical protein [Ensifer sp. B1-9]|uniref:hypothetical protein n=1 Tax=Ensifer sp. B1-9 TaxID=3141455 RepID=UPI003D25FEFF
MTWCVCIVKDGKSDRVEGTRDECVAMMVDMTGMPEEEAEGFLINALLIGKWGFTEPYELFVESL